MKTHRLFLLLWLCCQIALATAQIQPPTPLDKDRLTDRLYEIQLQGSPLAKISSVKLSPEAVSEAFHLLDTQEVAGAMKGFSNAILFLLEGPPRQVLVLLQACDEELALPFLTLEEKLIRAKDLLLADRLSQKEYKNLEEGRVFVARKTVKQRERALDIVTAAEVRRNYLVEVNLLSSGLSDADLLDYLNQIWRAVESYEASLHPAPENPEDSEDSENSENSEEGGRR